MRFLIFLLVVCLAPVAQAATGAGVMMRDSALRTEPNTAAEKLEALAKDSAVTVLQRQGGWYRIRSIAGNEGWVRMLSVRFKSRARTGVGGEIRTLSRFASDDAVATGVRGLSEDEQGGGAGTASLQPVHDLRVVPDEARQFAGAAGLKSRDIDYIDGED